MADKKNAGKMWCGNAFTVTIIPLQNEKSRVVLTNLGAGLSTTYVTAVPAGDLIDRVRHAAWLDPEDRGEPT